MSEATALPESSLQRQITQMARELAAQLEATARQAPLGSTLEACEALLLEQGRQFLRDSLAAALQQHIDRAEKRGGRRAPARAARPAATRGPGLGSSSPPSAPSA